MWEAGLRMGTWVLRPRLIFLAVVEHRLMSASVRSEWVRLKGKGMGLCLGSCFPGLFPCWSCWGWGCLSEGSVSRAHGSVGSNS